VLVVVLEDVLVLVLVLVDVLVEVDVLELVVVLVGGTVVVVVVVLELELVVVVVEIPGHNPPIQSAPIVINTNSLSAYPQHPQNCNVSFAKISGKKVVPSQSLYEIK
jgi:hypothetical protein